MAYFDTTLELDPITEQQSTPVLPEERHVFELVGFERSEPDEFRKDGGIKWTFRVFEEDGKTPFVFNDEQYLFFRTTNIDKKTRKPLFTVGSSANDWASALLGRTLGADAHFPIPELYGKRLSAMVVWKHQKRDATKWSVELASLRHVPVATQVPPSPSAALGMSSAEGNGHAPVPTQAQVEPDASSADVDRALAISKFEKKLERAKKRKLPALTTFTDAYAEIGDASRQQIEAWVESIDDALDRMDD